MSVIPSTGSMVFNNDTTPPVSSHELCPATPDGENGWYASDIEVTLNAMDDMSGVKAIKYKIGSGSWKSIDQTVPGSPTLCVTVIIDVDGSDLLTEYYAVDYAGNEEEVKSFVIKIDRTPSYGIVTDKNAGFHKIKFTVTVDASDETSGINRVEFWWDDELQHIDYEPPYEWIFTTSHSKEKGTLPILPIMYPFYVYDNAGNVGDSVGDNPVNKVRFLEQSSPLFFQILQRLMNIG